MNEEKLKQEIEFLKIRELDAWICVFSFLPWRDDESEVALESLRETIRGARIKFITGNSGPLSVARKRLSEGRKNLVKISNSDYHWALGQLCISGLSENSSGLEWVEFYLRRLRPQEAPETTFVYGVGLDEDKKIVQPGSSGAL